MANRDRYEVTNLGTKKSAVFFAESQKDAVDQALEEGLVQRRAYGRAVIMSFKGVSEQAPEAIRHAALSDARGIVKFDRSNGGCVVNVGERQFDEEGEV